MLIQIQRVSKADLWSVPKISLVAAMLAACADLIIFCSVGLATWILPEWFALPVLVIGLTILVFLLPASVAIAHHERFRNWWHGFLFGGVYGVTILAVIFLFYGLGRFVTSVRNDPVGLMIDCLLPASVAFGVSGSLFVILWVASRWSRGRLQILDGTSCPGCGYNLVGNTTSICSECGRPFTLDELEITAEDLEPVS